MQTEKVSKENKDRASAVTPVFRLSFPHLFKPSGMKGTPVETHKYSITMLFEKGDDDGTKDANMKWFNDLVRQARINKFGKDKDKWPKTLHPLKNSDNDGDSPKHVSKQGYKEHWALKASTDQDHKPTVWDQNVKEIIDPSKVYPGCYCKAEVYCYVWEFPKGSGKYGVSLMLNKVQKVKDGESFGGGKPADQVFDPVSGGDDEDDDSGNFGDEGDDEDSD